MTIKDVEQITGLPRSNIRFYEKEKLISPVRNTNNGYREYSEKDIETIKKIAYLRTLGISVEEIRKISNSEISLYDAVEAQRKNLEHQLSEIKNAKMMCDMILSSEIKPDYENLDIERYVTDVNDYWNQNRNIFKSDTVRFFVIWGGKIIWVLILAVCLLTAVISFGSLPDEIPVQWSKGAVSSVADKKFIFAFPAACLIIRFILRSFILRKLSSDTVHGISITDYIVNYLCFTVLSIEIFIILYINGIMKHVTSVLVFDTVLFGVLLIIAVYKMKKR